MLPDPPINRNRDSRLRRLPQSDYWQLQGLPRLSNGTDPELIASAIKTTFCQSNKKPTVWCLMRVDAVQRVRTEETTNGHCAARSYWLRTLMEEARGGPIR